MNKAYQLPHDKPNPFADSANATDAAGENASPYAGGAIPAASVDPGPGAYQATLTPRPQWLLGVSGFALLAAVGALIAAFLWFFPWGFVTLFIGSYGWAMARHDLRAMHYGAMEPSTRKEARLALCLAIAGTVASLISVALWVGWYWVLRAML